MSICLPLFIFNFSERALSVVTSFSFGSVGGGGMGRVGVGGLVGMGGFRAGWGCGSGRVGTTVRAEGGKQMFLCVYKPNEL